MITPVRWGVCATVKAPADDVLRFAAYYLDAGAHRVWIYLDAPNPAAHAALKSHPKCRVILCDDGYWRRIFGRRPKKHQVRQSANANRTLPRAGDVDWLLHADVDEFPVSTRAVSDILSDLPKDAVTARIRPMEVLAQSDDAAGPMAFKAFVPADGRRARTVSALYPRFGDWLKGGFVSHVAGKIFVRTNVPGMTLRIHNSFLGDTQNPGAIELDGIELAHLHAPDWRRWIDHFDFRLEKGAYRAELAPAQPSSGGGENLHALLSGLHASDGRDGLRGFFEEVCADTPVLRERLEAHGLLREHDLRLDALLHHHFPAHRAGESTV